MMGFSDQVYSVLVVSSSQKFNDTVSALLPGTDYTPVRFAGSVAEARQELVNRSFDFVIINAPLPDEFGTRLAIDLSGEGGTVALLLVRGEAFEEVNAKVIPQGVFTLSKPTSAQALRLALKWMASARERCRRQERKTVSVQEKVEEIRLVNRAKWLLIEKRNMSEPDAHHFIEKQAMDRCATRREIALGIIQSYA